MPSDDDDYMTTQGCPFLIQTIVVTDCAQKKMDAIVIIIYDCVMKKLPSSSVYYDDQLVSFLLTGAQGVLELIK